MYKSMLRTVSLQARSISKIGSGKRKQKTGKEEMEARYDFNRRWMQLRQAGSSLRRGSEQHPSTFKVVSYNILAQDLLMEHLYLYMGIQQEWLTWRRRQQNLQREILKLDPDILCLQEMQYDHLALLIQGLRMGHGRPLEYVYKKKTGHRTDGCAIVYDSSKFQLLDQRAVELHDQQVALLNRENVALFAKFRFKMDPDPCKEFVVATTHLLYNPKRNDVRCAQVNRMLEELSNFSDDAPVVLTGDFNSLGDSPAIEKLIGRQDKRETEKTETENTRMRFEIVNPGEGTGSTYQDDWIIVDYILRSISSRGNYKLLPVSIYTLPSINRCNSVGRIPNHYLGSDHYALGAVFAVV
ncbi:protein angel [Drosophila bipectinata]|uniref:protein angel n=1 Tax=Drosophila bipectinata TaxID=42026 RepID=UPI001C896F01|nr:protein angel [Drosophila bipectinata]